jgi:ELWxxDGT repeat protein
VGVTPHGEAAADAAGARPSRDRPPRGPDGRLWVTEGTPGTTKRVKDIHPGGSSAPTDLIALGDILYFVADDGVHGRELWRSDGTEAGTHIVRDIMEGAGDSSTERLTVFDGDLYFAADDGVTGNELWRVAPLPETGVVRYGGSSRFETAALLSEATFEPGVSSVYVATGLDFPDALTGAVAAALADAPVVLVTSASIPPATHDELERLDPSRIWVLGGEAVIGPAVATALGDYTAGPVIRFPDALTGVPAAAAVPGPLLVVTTNQVPPPTVAELQRLDPERIVVLGGAGAVSQAVATALEAHAGVVDRISGPERYSTAAAIAEEAFPEPEAVRTVFVATANAFPDALAAGAVAGAIPGPVLLSQHSTLPPPTIEQLERFVPHRIVVMGGTAAISEAVEAALEGYLAD